jgi:hypothetical protein
MVDLLGGEGISHFAGGEKRPGPRASAVQAADELLDLED